MSQRWRGAEAVQANLSDTMRQALVTLNVVHARDLKLQTRIACDDDRIMHAISRHDRALVVDENHPEHYQAERGMFQALFVSSSESIAASACTSSFQVTRLVAVGCRSWICCFL